MSGFRWDGACLMRRSKAGRDEAAEDAAWQATRILAQKHRLSAYDAAYLEVALRRGLPLGSLDGELRAAAKAENVSVLPEKLPR